MPPLDQSIGGSRHCPGPGAGAGVGVGVGEGEGTALHCFGGERPGLRPETQPQPVWALAQPSHGRSGTQNPAAPLMAQRGPLRDSRTNTNAAHSV